MVTPDVRLLDERWTALDGIVFPRRWIESICYSIYFLFRMNGEGAQRIAALMQSCWTLSGSIPQEFISSRRTLTFPSWNVTMHSQLWAPFYSSRPVAILPIARPFSHTFNFARQPPQLSARQPFQLWWIRSPLFFFWPAPGRIVGIVDWVGMRRRHWECPVGPVGPVGPVDGRDARELWELSRGMPGRGRRGVAGRRVTLIGSRKVSDGFWGFFDLDSFPSSRILVNPTFQINERIQDSVWLPLIPGNICRFERSGLDAWEREAWEREAGRRSETSDLDRITGGVGRTVRILRVERKPDAMLKDSFGFEGYFWTRIWFKGTGQYSCVHLWDPFGYFTKASLPFVFVFSCFRFEQTFIFSPTDALPFDCVKTSNNRHIVVVDFALKHRYGVVDSVFYVPARWFQL